MINQITRAVSRSITRPIVVPSSSASELTFQFIPLINGTFDSSQLSGSTQPDIIVSNPPAEGQSATVSSNTITMPAVSPNIIIFDDYSGHNVGDTLDTTATIGTYTGINGGGFDNKYIAGRGGVGIDGGSTRFGLVNVFDFTLPNLEEVFISHAYKVNTWPSETIPNQFNAGSNWKMSWFTSELGVIGSGKSNICLPSNASNKTLTLAGNSHNFNTDLKLGLEASSSWTSWNMVQTWMKADPLDTRNANADGYQSICSDKGFFESSYKGQMFNPADVPNPTYKQANFPGWVEPSGNGDPTLCDLYVADSPVRALIGNHPYIHGCTKLAIQTTASHTVNGFEFVYRLADLNPDTELLFLFIVDEANELVTMVGKLLN